MKKLYNHRIYASINGDKFDDTSYFSHITYMEQKEEQEMHFKTFEEFYEFVKNNNLIGIKTEEIGFFSSKPAVCINRVNKRTIITLTKRDFKEVKIIDTYYLYNENITIKELSSELTAEEFIEWLKDRGVEKIII